MIENEKRYLELLTRVAETGELRKNRTGVDTLSLFGEQLRLDLGVEHFPLFTTKRVHWKSVVHELLWMLSGSSNISYLQANGVTIWDEWASTSYRPEMGYGEGELGPVYGVQWRHWSGVDQIAEIVNKLRHHRDDRRILLSSWNVAEISRMKLPPCHYAAQFYVDKNFGLHCLMSIRSWDLFLGGPFNIAQYALLTHMLAQVSGLVPRRLIINAGDAHLYVNHLDQLREQKSRIIHQAPRLALDPSVREIDDFRFEHCKLEGYDPHPAIKGDVAI